MKLELRRGMAVVLVVPVDCTRVRSGERGVIISSEGDADVDSPATALCRFADSVIAVDRTMVELAL